MRWPNPDEWLKIVMMLLLFGIWEVARECRNYLRSIMDEIYDFKHPHRNIEQ
jgi:hypothetical protein